MHFFSQAVTKLSKGDKNYMHMKGEQLLVPPPKITLILFSPILVKGIWTIYFFYYLGLFQRKKIGSLEDDTIFFYG